jgi:hypothetical protein
VDLFTTNAAHSISASEAQRAGRELEYRRIAHERAATAKRETPAKPQKQHRSVFGTVFRLRLRSAH